MGCAGSKNSGASGSIQASSKKDGVGGGGSSYPTQKMKPTATITPQVET